jgi:hypothetical protein
MAEKPVYTLRLLDILGIFVYSSLLKGALIGLYRYRSFSCLKRELLFAAQKQGEEE